MNATQTHSHKLDLNAGKLYLPQILLNFKCCFTHWITKAKFAQKHILTLKTPDFKTTSQFMLFEGCDCLNICPDLRTIVHTRTHSITADREFENVPEICVHLLCMTCTRIERVVA